MADHHFAESIKAAHEFFNRSTAIFDDGDSAFAPKPEMLSVAYHIAHVALCVDWFVDGAFSPKGFDMDFEKMHNETLKFTTVTAARAEIERAFKAAIDFVNSKSTAEMMTPMAPNDIMGQVPRVAFLSALTDHTAHHRGSLAVYARLLGKVPPMPYM